MYEFNNRREAMIFARERNTMLRFSILHEKGKYAFHSQGKQECFRVRSVFNKHMGLDWGSWKCHHLPKNTPQFLVEVLVDGH